MELKNDKEYVIPLDEEKLEQISKQIQQVIWPECVEPTTLKEVLEYVKEHLEEKYEEYLQGAVDSTACGLDCGSLKLIYNHILELQERINKAIEYIKEKYNYLIDEDDTFLDHDERIDRKQILNILDILQGKDENK